MFDGGEKGEAQTAGGSRSRLLERSRRVAGDADLAATDVAVESQNVDEGPGRRPRELKPEARPATICLEGSATMPERNRGRRRARTPGHGSCFGLVIAVLLGTAKRR